MKEKRYIITDDGITDNEAKKQYNKITSKKGVLNSISFSNLIDLVNILNEQDQKIKELEKTLKLVSEATSSITENSVKEIIRNNLFGLDSVAGESANAFNDYLILNKFFKEYYNEHWDNDKFD